MRPLATLLLATALFSGPVEAADRYLIATRHAPERIVGRDFRAFHTVNAFAATLTADEAAALEKSPEVRYVSRVVERHALSDAAIAAPFASPAVPQRLPYGIAMIHAPEIWKLTKGSRQVNVAVLDTGIDRQHADLSDNYAGGYNTFAGFTDTAPDDDNGHGTHVAGTIAAEDNEIGVVGVAPQVRVWAVKVLDRYGYGYDENIAAGIDWVINQKQQKGGDWIISLSLGSTVRSKVEQEVVARAVAGGIIIAAAAGNHGTEYVDYPAAYDGVIAVGAVDSTGALASFSDRGPRLDIVAPGVGILSSWMQTMPFAGVAVDSGATFAAAPLAGSSAGEVRAAFVACGAGNPQDFPADVKGKVALIRRGDISFNAKVVNAEAAGAVAVVIFNQDDSDFSAWSLNDVTRIWPLVLAVSAADGQRLLEDTAHIVDLGSWTDNYLIMSGTSQATPHVAGAAALLWSLDPNRSADEVKAALLSAADDLGAPGRDARYGDGLVDVLAAAKKLVPWRFDRDPAAPSPDVVPAIP